MRTLPDEFVNGLSAYPQLDGLAEALATTAPEVSVRVSGIKGMLPAAGTQAVPWCPLGFYLDRRPSFTFDPQLHQGLYYVQDASSMILWQIARRLNTGAMAGAGPLRWLDACAAPGGKTLCAVDALAPGSLVHAHEFDPRRCAALVENVERWGCPDVVVTRGDTSQLTALKSFYDVIALDAPCSGEGMMRKEEVAVTQWTPALTARCAALQRQIAADLWPALRPGGFMVYSTCTFNVRENEENVMWMTEEFGAEPVDLGLDGYPGVVGDITGHGLPVARFLPGRVRGEGLFVCVLRKPGDGAAAKATMPGKFRPAALPAWLDGPFVGVEYGDTLGALPKDNAAAMLHIASKVQTRLTGVTVGTRKGRDIVPAQPLALTTALKADAFSRCEADLPQALAFLRGEPLHLDGADRGFVLLTFNRRPLGFVKNIGNRANNLLAANRRIMAPLPDPLPGILPLNSSHTAP